MSWSTWRTCRAQAVPPAAASASALSTTTVATIRARTVSGRRRELMAASIGDRHETGMRERRAPGGLPGARVGAWSAQEVLDPPDPLDEVLHAERVAQPQVAARAERLTGDDGDLHLLEDELGELRRRPRGAAADRPAEHALDVGVGVERAAGGGHLDAVDLAQHADHRAAPLVERRAHLVDGGQVAG